MARLNVSLNSTESSESTETDDLLVITFWTIILIYALITNTLTVIGISRSQSMRSASSYHIVISLAVCDLFMIVVSLIHIIPATYLHEDFVEIQHPRTIWAMFLYNVFWYSGVVQLAAMAVNRFVSIVYPLHYKRVFAPRNTFLIIGSLYLLGLLSSLPSLHDCCYIVYDHHIYVTYYVPEDSNYMWLDILLNSLSLLTMIVCYGAILLRVRRSTLARRKHQMAAVVARARRTSNVALLSVAPSTTVDSNSIAPSINNSAKTKNEKLPSNGVTKSREHNLLEHSFALSNSSSLSVLQEDKNKHCNNNDGAPKKSPVARTTSAEPILFRARTYAIKIQESKKDENLEAREKLLAPEPRLRRQAILPSFRQKQQQPQQASRREIRLFVQFFVVSLVFLSTWVTWQWLPRIPNASKWIYFSTTTFFFV